MILTQFFSLVTEMSVSKGEQQAFYRLKNKPI